MAFQKKTWIDRQTQYPNKRTLTPVSGENNAYTVARAEGDVFAEGDKFDAENMNDLENRIYDSLSKIDVAETPDAIVELHNSLYRGKVLTDSKTYNEIMQAVKSGDFSDIYAGDIIELDTPAITLTNFAETKKKQYVIIGINSLMEYGDTPLNKPHLVIMPLDDLGTGKMNQTNITTGAYEGSYMNKTIMPAVVTALKRKHSHHKRINGNGCKRHIHIRKFSRRERSFKCMGIHGFKRKASFGN